MKKQSDHMILMMGRLFCRNRKSLLICVTLLFLLPGIRVSAQDADHPAGPLYTVRPGLKNKRISSTDTTGANRDFIVDIKDGEKRMLADISGAGIINHIWLTIFPKDINRNDIIIRMYWDGNTYPSVEAPLGAFFGQGWDEYYTYTSYALSAAPVGGKSVTSYFQMPFSKGARIEIENQTGRVLNYFYYYIDYVETKSLPKNAGRFHAWYNRKILGAVNGKPHNRDGTDNYVFADIRGTGHFVGINYYVQSPNTAWYGEGDDMWYIDGAVTPSLKGTGTEDFFNTAWCPKEVYCTPYFGYPRVNNNIGWLGRTHCYRYFIQDPVYFNTALKGTIEHGAGNNMTLDIATVAYWYQDKAASLPPSLSKEDRKLLPLINDNDIMKWRREWEKGKDPAKLIWGNE